MAATSKLGGQKGCLSQRLPSRNSPLHVSLKMIALSLSSLSNLADGRLHLRLVANAAWPQPDVLYVQAA